MDPGDITELNQLAYRYAYAVDTCDTGHFKDVFASDGRLCSYNPGEEEPFSDLRGSEEMAVIPATMQDMFKATAHMMTNHMVFVTGDTASGNLLCTARHLLTDGGSVLNVHIRYEDEYVRVDGQWKILHRHIRFLWTERSESSDNRF